MIVHLALIMDGNRRWAQKRLLFPWLGHKEGVKTAQMAIEYCLQRKIRYLSLYAFSLENFKRNEQEISYLFSLIEQAQSRINEFIDKKVQIRFIGDRQKIPSKTLAICEQIEEATQQGDALQCNVLLCYGAQQEIVHAAQALMSLGQLVTEQLFKDQLWLGDIPSPDLIIRTGGVKRLSNFLLYQAAYAEIRFLDCLWPDLTEQLLHETVVDSMQVRKNLGQ